MVPNIMLDVPIGIIHNIGMLNMTVKDTFPKEALYRVVLSMPIEVEVMATDRDAAEDDARPHAFEMLQDFMDAHDLGPSDFDLTEMEIHPDLD